MPKNALALCLHYSVQNFILRSFTTLKEVKSPQALKGQESYFRIFHELVQYLKQVVIYSSIAKNQKDFEDPLLLI